jgi:hypothetical protein
MGERLDQSLIDLPGILLCSPLLQAGEVGDRDTRLLG